MARQSVTGSLIALITFPRHGNNPSVNKSVWRTVAAVSKKIVSEKIVKIMKV